jgi:hypothetical protein
MACWTLLLTAMEVLNNAGNVTKDKERSCYSSLEALYIGRELVVINAEMDIQTP